MAKQKEAMGWSEDSIDWDNVSTEPPPPLERGVYRATIEEASPHTSEKTGGASFAVTLVVNTRYGEAEGAVGNRKMYDYLSFAAAGRIKQICEGTGVRPPKNRTEAVGEEFCAELLGKEVWIRSRLEPKTDRAGKAIANEFVHKVDRYLREDQCAETAAALAGNAVSSAPTTDAEEGPAVQRRKGSRRAA